MMKKHYENLKKYVDHVESVKIAPSGLPPIPSQPFLQQAAGTNVMDLKSCPHKCGADFHTGPLTRQIMNMFTSHSFNPDYDPDKDDSPILCVGSEVEGPVYSPGGSPWPDDPFMMSPWTLQGPSWQDLMTTELDKEIIYGPNPQMTGTVIDGVMKSKDSKNFYGAEPDFPWAEPKSLPWHIYMNGEKFEVTEWSIDHTGKTTYKFQKHNPAKYGIGWKGIAGQQPWVVFKDESAPVTYTPYYPQYQMHSDQSGYNMQSLADLKADGWQQLGYIKDESLAVKKHPVKWLDDMITGTMKFLQDTLNFTYHYQLETNSWVPGKPEPKECPEITVEFGPDNWVTKHEWFPNGYPQPAIEAAKEIEKHKYPPNITPWGDLSDWIKKTSKEINDSYPKVSYPDETK